MELFWDWVKSSFALEPGEFADLLSGVGTLLAFVLGLVILFQDRQRQARIQAGRFVAYAEALDDWNGFDIVERHLIIRMTNTNDVPMHLVSVMTSQKSQEFINLVVRDESLDKDSLVEKGVAFKPGENWVKRFTVSGPILRAFSRQLCRWRRKAMDARFEVAEVSQCTQTTHDHRVREEHASQSSGGLPKDRKESCLNGEASLNG